MKKKQILKGIGVWILFIVLTAVFVKTIITISNPFYVPEHIEEQIRNEEGLN